jgi:hypothetical protein
MQGGEMGTRLLMRASNFLARLPGLPVLVAVGLVVVNFALQFAPTYPAIRWVVQYNLFLHLGLVIGLISVLLGDAL